MMGKEIFSNLKAFCVKLPLLPLSQGRAAAQYAQRGQAEAEGDAFFPGCGQISRS